MIDNNEFMEGQSITITTTALLLNMLMKNWMKEKDVLLEIDVQGALNLQEKYPSAVYIFIAPRK